MPLDFRQELRPPFKQSLRFQFRRVCGNIFQRHSTVLRQLRQNLTQLFFGRETETNQIRPDPEERLRPLRLVSGMQGDSAQLFFSAPGKFLQTLPFEPGRSGCIRKRLKMDVAQNQFTFCAFRTGNAKQTGFSCIHRNAENSFVCPAEINSPLQNRSAKCDVNFAGPVSLNCHTVLAVRIQYTGKSPIHQIAPRGNFDVIRRPCQGSVRERGGTFRRKVLRKIEMPFLRAGNESGKEKSCKQKQFLFHFKPLTLQYPQALPRK